MSEFDGVGKLINEVDESLLHVTAQEDLLRSLTTRRDRVVDYLRGFDVTINVAETKKHAPDWLDVDSLFSLVEETGSTDFWNALLRRIPEQQAALAVHNLGACGDIFKSAEVIHESNLEFFSTTLAISFLALALGREVKHSEKEYRHNYPGSYRVTNGMGVAQALADRYKQRAKTPEEFFQRVKDVIPNPDTVPVAEGRRGKKAPTLLDLIALNDSMAHFGQRQSAGLRIARVILEEYGRLLDNPEFAARFLSRITKISPQK